MLTGIRPADTTRSSVPVHWRYPQVRELLMQAANLTPIEKAERRVLVLCNPGLGIDNLDTLCIYRSSAL